MRIEFQKNKTKGSLHLLHFLFSDIADTSQNTPWSISPGSCSAAAPAMTLILSTGSSTPSAPSGPGGIYTSFLVLGLAGFYNSSLEMNPGLARLVTGPCGAGGRAQSLLAPPAPPLPRLAPGCLSELHSCGAVPTQRAAGGLQDTVEMHRGSARTDGHGDTAAMAMAGSRLPLPAAAAALAEVPVRNPEVGLTAA